MHQSPDRIMENLISRYSNLRSCQDNIYNAYNMLIDCYEADGKVLIAGNGGSGADAGHIVGELMKGFMLKRPITGKLYDRLANSSDEMGLTLAAKLQEALPAIDLTAHNPLNTAFSNDVDASLIFAQQVLGYGNSGDVFWGLSTSGNSKNIIYAIYTAKAKGLKTLAMTGKSGGDMANIADITIKAPATSTPEIQELHLPIYHALCAMVEAHFFRE